MKKEFIKEHIREAIIGIGASVVIIGAWLKITYIELGPIDGDLMLTVGLITEAVIFAIIGVEAYVGGSSKSEKDDLKTIDIETEKLQKAVDNTVKGLSELNSNISNASKATATIKVPSDMEKNTDDFNKGLSSASSNIHEVAKVFNNLKETIAAFENVNMPEGLGDEMQKMKETVKELNAKYEAMLGAMNK
tara:strand:+ start:1017 stop:1589 length:573 start_codon:yes stop_codon:yes gene_type:complete